MENITAVQYLMSLDENNTVFDLGEDYEYSERQLIEFSDEFAKVKTATIQAKLEKAKELLNRAKKDIVLMSASLYFDAGNTIEESEKEANNAVLIREITTFLEAK